MITIKTLINKPIGLVWDKYTSAQDMNNWNHASPDWSCKDSRIDLQDGGRFESTMYAKDGSFEFTFGGMYDKVLRGEQILSTLGDGRKMNVYFKAVNKDTTEIQIDFDAENQNSEQMQRDGWQAILDNFAKYCA